MANDFTEDFEDEPLPEEFEEEEVEAPPKVRGRPQQQARPAAVERKPETPAPQKRPAQVQAQAPASAPVQTQQVRFVPFEIPTRVGVFDNTTGRPLMEESPKSIDKLDLIMAKLDVIFGLEVELTNKIDEIQKNI